MKKCPMCQSEKTPDEFWTRRKSPDGLDSYCKECRKARTRKYRKESPRQIATNRRIKREQSFAKKKIILDHYGWKCANCPYNDHRALTVDHIKGDGAAHRKKVPGYKLYSWLIENNFPEGFQILCMCCQFIKRYENHEWRKPS